MAATESKTYPITPEQLKSIKFRSIKRGGYDPEEVDLFVHQLATIISHSPEDIFGKGTSSEEGFDTDSAAQRLLSAAQRTADQLIADSKEQATQLIASAEAQADNVKRIVSEEAREMAEEAQLELKNAISELMHRKQHLIEDCQALSAELQAGKDQLLTTLEEIKLMINVEETFTFHNQLDDDHTEMGNQEISESSEFFVEDENLERGDNSTQATLELSQADLISVDELMDSPPELTLIRNAETNEDWLNKEVKKTEEDMSDLNPSEDWDNEVPTELIQTVQDENITTGDRFFEELESQDKSPLGKADELTNEAMDDFFGN
tara:strand:+ start:27049 stop:28011 length:963 start_codon:yes stop_codon:yes gene_type:complete